MTTRDERLAEALARLQEPLTQAKIADRRAAAARVLREEMDRDCWKTNRKILGIEDALWMDRTRNTWKKC